MLRRFWISTFGGAMLFQCAFAQIEEAPQVFRELRVLDGVWFMAQDRGDRLEIWKLENDSTLVGREVRIKAEGGDTVLLRSMRIERRGDTIIYYLTLRGLNNNRPIPYELVLADREGFWFENLNQDSPQKIRYRLLGRRELQIYLENKRGNRTVTDEFVYEREFSPPSTEFRLRGGLNVFTIRATGNFPSSDNLDFVTKNPQTSPAIGWELGSQFLMKGTGGFLTVNFELSLVGKSAHSKASFTAFVDTGVIGYVRRVRYHQVWMVLAALPEVSLRREGNLSVTAGPYYGRLLFNGASGEEKPAGENRLFDANNDFKNNDFGIIAGLQYRFKSKKKDIGSVIGLRANLGLSDIDALYRRHCRDLAFCNGRISMQGISLFYSFNLLKI
ncbi:MAG: DUF6265 family protein [Saprospiraceae bacterium]|nr:DUF6265 family protein [Saprospiraceae bacterium]MDW8484614.1 DUF6265 family protein [Saprospiraceae bacterium]